MTVVNATFKKQFPATLKSLLSSHKAETMKAVNVCRVAVIQSFDPGEVGVRAASVNVLIAQKAVTSIAPDGTKTLADYTPIQEVPVVFMGGGGVTHTFPINAGDECLLIFHDRHLDDWFVNGAGLPPGMGRLHDISDAIAIVGVRSSPRALANISTTASQLRTDDGEAFLEVGIDHHISLITPAGKVIDANGMTIDSSGNVTIPGTLNVTGNATITGTVTGAGVGLDTHHHTGVQTGSGNTGGPIG